ncbi:MAG: hypothetical protein RLZZ140_818 [Pseudomonadota bacterium]
MDIAQLIQTITIYAIPVVFAITVHEAAHGYAARFFGDLTAYHEGRITLNPLRHIDPVGTILIPLMLYFATAGAFLFGYAKPVPVDFSNLRHPKKDMVWVALLAGIGINEPFWVAMCKAGILVNVVMFVFNLFPLPPMDGGRILVGLLPWRQAMLVSRIEPYGFFIVLGLLVAGIINNLWMRPLMELTYRLIDIVLIPLRMLLN